MKVLKKFTLKDLKLNKKRSIVTIIAIVLATALICAVSTMFYSFLGTMNETLISSEGNYHVIFKNTDNNFYKKLSLNRDVESLFKMKTIGYVENDLAPYAIKEVDKEAFNHNFIVLSDGRLPRNSNELLVSDVYNRFGDVSYHVGDSVTFKYIPTDDINNVSNTTNVELIEKTYKVVGTIKSGSWMLTSDQSAPYSFISYIDDNSSNYDVGVVFTNIRNTYKNIKAITKNNDIEYKANKDLLDWNGVARSENTQKILYTLLLVIIGIIVACSVFVIRNSFAISITEKKKEIGMLSSVGATKKQIRAMVIREGLYLSVIAIPIGILLGLLASYILCVFSNSYLFSSFVTVEESMFTFKMCIPVATIIVTVIGALVTVLLSCLASAFKAGRISAIEAIRSNDEIKINKKKIKSSRFIKKFFGIGGVIASKNLKRSKKKYRTTIISLVVSITVFVSLSYFLSIFKTEFDSIYNTVDINVEIYLNSEKESDIILVEPLLKKKKLTNKYMIEYSKSYQSNLLDCVDSEYGKNIGDGTMYTSLLPDNIYHEFVKKNNLTMDEVKNKMFLLVPESKFDKYEDIKTLEIETDNGVKNIDVIVTKELPWGFMGVDAAGSLVGSMDNKDDLNIPFTGMIYVNALDAKEFKEQYNKLEINDSVIVDMGEEAALLNKIITWVSVFLYGFIIVISLIGVTNVFNTITTNMNLRSKEFAMLKSVGMTSKEFNSMIRLENIIYGLKSFIIGSVLGLGISYFLIYKNIDKIAGLPDTPFNPPYIAIIISFIFITLVVGLIMKYSMSRINKQNIIETIRKDTI